ncbi:MAG: ferritin family protein [Ktedonobacteraceae bacterium]
MLDKLALTLDILLRPVGGFPARALHLFSSRRCTTVTKDDVKRYRANIRAEQEGVALYQALARAEQDSHLAELYRHMAQAEQQHATIWADHLRRAGVSVPEALPGWVCTSADLAGTALRCASGTPLFKSASRQVLLRLAAAAVTFSLGRRGGRRLG